MPTFVSTNSKTMTTQADAIVWVRDQIAQGKLAASKANVAVVQIMGVRVVINRIPLAVRKELNAAVKAGELGHIKKEGNRPECYHHKNARVRALEERDRIYSSIKSSVSAVCAGHRIGLN
jgi:hypothetical protein